MGHIVKLQIVTAFKAVHGKYELTPDLPQTKL